MQERSTQDRLEFMADTLRQLSSDLDPVRSINGYATAIRELYTDRGLISVSLRGAADGEYRIMRLLHQDGVTGPSIESIPFAGPEAPFQSGGFLGEILAPGKPVVLRDLHLPNDPVLGVQLQPYRMLMACPVFDLGRLTNWVIFLHTDPDAFMDRDLETWLLQANMMSSITNTKRMAEEVVQANAYIQQQVNEIAEIQQRLLPSRLPHIPGLDLAAMFATYDRAGGDYYDVFPMRQLEGADEDDPRWLFLMADASGHGPSAAVLVSVLSALMYSHPGAPELPGQLMAYLNDHLMRKSLYNAFVTALLLIYNPMDRSIEFTSAGHPMPLLRRACGQVEELPRTGGIPLGIMPKVVYSTAVLRIEPGQSLLLYTDGITEARNVRREMFETERLRAALAVCRQRAQDTLDTIVDQLRAHEGGQQQQDDQTMMVLLATE